MISSIIHTQAVINTLEKCYGVHLVVSEKRWGRTRGGKIERFCGKVIKLEPCCKNHTCTTTLRSHSHATTSPQTNAVACVRAICRAERKTTPCKMRKERKRKQERWRESKSNEVTRAKGHWERSRHFFTNKRMNKFIRCVKRSLGMHTKKTV